MNVPGVKVGRYKGLSTPDLIEKLRQDNVNVSWYGKHSKPKAQMEFEKCGYFTVFYLEGEWAWTLTTGDSKTPGGDKYQKARKLKRPEPTSCWYCGACKNRFTDREAALSHRNIGELERN